LSSSPRERSAEQPSPPGAKKFYRNLFDGKLEDAPGMEYTMIDGGGMMRNPQSEVHSFWLPYVLAPAILGELIRDGEERRRG
jgi:predicted enzyme related to lactoylglutathione lyase